MMILSAPREFQSACRALRAEGLTLGLVPTMGALHEGHLQLVRASLDVCDRTAVSIFVNPLQFGPQEDLDRYPRTFEADRAALGDLGVDLLFAPTTAQMYAVGAQTLVQPGPLASELCGKSRPHHFVGVTTVVAKLFHLAGPSQAFFGQKDYQQARILLQMVDDLDFDLEMRVLPTVRESDGLALSSRNRLLSPAAREQAPALHRALLAVRQAFDAGERDVERLLAPGRAVLAGAPLLREDYLRVLDDPTLQPVDRVGAAAVAAIAAFAGETRLIDNELLGEAQHRLSRT
jgi:pantoate--beta-alanine ligase